MRVPVDWTIGSVVLLITSLPPRRASLSEKLSEKFLKSRLLHCNLDEKDIPDCRWTDVEISKQPWIHGGWRNIRKWSLSWPSSFFELKLATCFWRWNTDCHHAFLYYGFWTYVRAVSSETRPMNWVYLHDDGRYTACRKCAARFVHKMVFQAAWKDTESWKQAGGLSVYRQ